jgi:hypothetical protein
VPGLKKAEDGEYKIKFPTKDHSFIPDGGAERMMYMFRNWLSK